MRSIGLIMILLAIPLIGPVDGKETVVDQSFRIEAGEFRSWEFDSDGTLTLYLSVSSQLWTFSVYLLDEEDFEDLEGGREFEHEYQADMIYNANLTWEVPEGKHYLVVINNFDDQSVNLKIKIETESLENVCCGSIMIGSAVVLGSLCAVVIILRKRS